MEEKKVWLFLHQSTGFETLDKIQTLEPSRRIERNPSFNIRLMEYGRGSWKGAFRLPFSATSRSPRGLKATGSRTSEKLKEVVLNLFLIINKLKKRRTWMKRRKSIDAHAQRSDHPDKSSKFVHEGQPPLFLPI